MALAAKESTGLRALTTVGWFSLLPELPCAGGLVAPDVCPLVLGAARGLPAAMHGDAQNGRRLATTRDGPAVVGSAGPWPRCDVPALLPHGGPSDSPVQ